MPIDEPGVKNQTSHKEADGPTDDYAQNDNQKKDQVAQGTPCSSSLLDGSMSSNRPLRPIIDDENESEEKPTTRHESDQIGQLEPVKQESDDSLFKVNRIPINRQESEELFKERTSSKRKLALRRFSSSDRIDVSHLLEVRHSYLVAYTALYGLSVWQTSFALVGNS